MPTDAGTDQEKETPSAPPPQAPAGPSLDEVRALIREEVPNAIRSMFAPEKEGGQKAPRTDKELEEFTEGIVKQAMAHLAEAEAAAGRQTPDPGPDSTHEPEEIPESRDTWQEKVRRFLWGE